MQNQSEFDRLDDRAKAPVRSSDPHSVKPLSPKPQGLGLTGFFYKSKTGHLCPVLLLLRSVSELRMMSVDHRNSPLATRLTPTKKCLVVSTAKLRYSSGKQILDHP